MMLIWIISSHRVAREYEQTHKSAVDITTVVNFPPVLLVIYQSCEV